MTEKILLLGNNALTAGIAQNLEDSEVELILATPDRKADLIPAVEEVVRNNQVTKLLTQSRVTACRGSVGNFSVRLSADQKMHSLDISQIVIAEDAEEQTDYSIHDIHPDPSIISLSEIEKDLMLGTEIKSQYSQAQRLVFLIGLYHETTPENTRRAMELAQKIQETGRQAYILTGNLKVGDQGLERLYRQVRDVGVVLIKFYHTRPRIQMNESDRVVIEFDDEIAGRPFRLNPDLTILDEAARPAAYLRDLISILGLETDPSGFAQADNVHRIGVRTNRAGILVAGPARNLLSQREHRLDIAAASLQGSIPMEQPEPETLAGAEIDPGSCIRCLTCYRLCPYGAIQVNTRVQVLSRACEACGLCAAECPRGAIQVPGMNGFNIGARLVDPNRPGKSADLTPKILAFCCTRSAFPASRLAVGLTPTLPRGLKIIEIPCAGGLSLDHLLTGFRNGADGTLVLTCHTDNCHARHGNQRALERVEMLQSQFTSIGLEKERLHFATLASNMGTAFADIVTDFEKKLRELGPSKLKQQT